MNGFNFYGCTLTSANFNFDYAALNGFNGTTAFVATRSPAGSTISFSPSSMTSNGQVTLTVGNLGAVSGGDYQILVNATSGGVTKTVPFYLSIGLSPIS